MIIHWYVNSSVALTNVERIPTTRKIEKRLLKLCNGETLRTAITAIVCNQGNIEDYTARGKDENVNDSVGVEHTNTFP